MKELIQKILGKRLFDKLYFSRQICNKLYRKDKSLYIIKLAKCFFITKVYKEKEKGKSLKKLFSKVSLDEYSKNDKFYYSLDVLKTVYRENMILGNITVDYSKILNNSLLDLKKLVENNKVEEKFYENELETIEGIEILIDRIIKFLTNHNVDEKIIENFKNIKQGNAKSFYEALQRILFFNQLLWQTSHTLNGLGRLDIMLYGYYENDIKQGVITKEEARELIKEFMLTLHKYYYFKSNVLMGDTGQIIELGGKGVNGNYQYNELTYMFIEELKKINVPDPKILLRVSKDVPKDLIEKSLECIQTGIGCPLFANDDVIIPKLIDFGYKKEDAYNYGTSACWEPYIIGKSLDANNISGLVFIKPFQNLIENEKLTNITNKKQLIELYKKYAKEYVDNLIKTINSEKWERDPILSLLTDECIKRNQDISQGGAIYNNYGLTGVGLSNLVNSIMNIDEFVFRNKEYTFSELNEIRKQNFENNDELLKKLKGQTAKYGTDNEEVIQLSNDIIKIMSNEIEKYKNPLGGRYKFGLSSPNYISSGKNLKASFDGRKNGEPFGVHISCDSSNAYTELIQFASKLNYGENRFNGNVVDFFISPNFISDNFAKFTDFLMASIKIGFFEMQMNVVSSATLIEARKNPDKFPNLIVRVWGFSAYFKDLPDEYKDYIIERALKSESNS